MADEKNEVSPAMKVPADVLQRIKVLAALDGKNVYEFNDSELRTWIERRYQTRLAREAKAFDDSDPVFANSQPELGGEG